MGGSDVTPLYVRNASLSSSPRFREDGFIAMHDVILFDPEIEVHRFWDELKAIEKTEELVHDFGQGNLGIGIVRR